MKTAEWTAALRSGKYEQGQNALCSGGAFCCLGVLAEISGFEKVANEEEGYVEYLFSKDGIGETLKEDAVIPYSLQRTILEDLDLRARVPSATIGGNEFWAEELHARLISLNDNGVTFEQIADYIDGVASGQR
jgi:hypothetical protein